MNPSLLAENVRSALSEDIGDLDITAQLIEPCQKITAQITCQQPAVLCGRPWVEEVYRQLDSKLTLQWLHQDGDCLAPHSLVLYLKGRARSILKGERCALNGLQTLSATATQTRRYQQALAHTHCTLLDTRKTLPGLRDAQKYAVRCGGGSNHRMGLYDAYLIKENHIMSCGSIAQAIDRARHLDPQKIIEIEVETLDELEQALLAQADIVMLDNFDLEMIHQAVTLNQGRAKLEVSGRVHLSSIQEIAAAGVDFISVGALTKHIQAIDFSLRVIDAT